jgi:hypothetical protein
MPAPFMDWMSIIAITDLLAIIDIQSIKVAEEDNTEEEKTDPQKEPINHDEVQKEMEKYNFTLENKPKVNCCNLTMDDIGTVAVGLELYFRLIKRLAQMFFLLSLINILI